MKICVVVASHWEAVSGGSQLQARGLVEKLAADGHEVFYLAREVRSDFHATDHIVVRLKGWQISGVFDSWSLYRSLSQISPDVIYQRVGGAWTAVCANYARRRGVPMVWHIASDMDVTRQVNQPGTLNPLHYVDWMMREYGLRHTPFIVAQTELQARLLEENYQRKVDKVIRNYQPEPSEDLLKSDVVQIVWIGNLKPVKQPEKFIQLARDMRNLSSVRFLMIGRGWGVKEKQDHFLSEVASVENLEYLGGMSNDSVNKILAASHILVNTSTIEGFSNTFIQAWMREVPVLSLNVNPDNVLSDCVVGIAASGDYSALVNGLRKLATDNTVRERMGKEARRYARITYSLKNLDQLADFIISQASEKPP